MWREDIPDGPPDFVSPLGSEAGGVGVGPMSAPEAESSQGGSLTLTGPSRLSTFAMARLPLQLEAEQESEVGQRNLCVLFCKGWYPTKVYLQGLLPHLLCIAAIAVGIRVRNWGIVIAGEGASFSSGRLDMPLKSGTGALASREDLKELCEKLFRAPCVHSGRGAFWNFPNSGPEHWHRDGQLPLLTAVTVAKGYPKNAGFLRLQPFTHHGAIDEDADSHREPKVHAGESERVAAILQPGDLLLFLYSTKHAAGKQVVNLSQISRSQNSKAFGCLGLPDWVYGPRGARDPEWDDDSTCSDDSDGPSCQTSSDSPVESCFESRMPVAIRPKSAKASWADLAEEEELENAQMVQPKPPTAKPKVNWADLQEASDDDLPSWKLGLSRHNPRGFNVARFTALLLNGVLVVVVGVVVLTLATLNVNSDWSAFCKEGTPGCKYYEVPIFSANTTTPVECNQHYTYGVRGEKALSIPDFALFSALAYESEDAWGHTGFLYERHEMGLKPSAFVPRVRCF
eukprot:g21339.t1